ncbi:MAG: helix-turn-helix domain-containing protein [Aristaeellaceae bacterium]
MGCGEESIWDMIDRGIAGSNVDLVLADGDCKVMKLSDETGEGVMTMYRVFDGVYLMFNDFHMAQCCSRFRSRGSLLAVDHCREGCMEMDVDGGLCCCLNRGEVRIDTRIHHSGQVRFPLRHYHGVTIGFQTGLAEASIREKMPAFAVDIQAMLRKFCGAGKASVLPADASIDNVFMQLYHLPKRSQMDYFKLKVMELLVYLEGVELADDGRARPYFCRTQVEKIHALHDLITSDLRANHTQEELAAQFGLGLTAMKQCFKSIYGKPIHQYLKAYRMSRAAVILLTEREKPVTEVAVQCGYDNPGKFGQVFRAQFGMAPLEYRKCNGRRDLL